jgi:hypothetical protein
MGGLEDPALRDEAELDELGSLADGALVSGIESNFGRRGNYVSLLLAQPATAAKAQNAIARP